MYVRSLGTGRADILEHETHCCPTNISVYFPITAVSADTREHIILEVFLMMILRV